MTVRESSDHAPLAALERPVSAIASARRAVVAERYAANSFAVEWRDLERLEPIADEWRALAARALEPNVFYEPAFALAAAPVFGRDAGAVLVWSGTRPRKLLGFFPARIARRRYGLKLPVLVGWTHPYAPLGTPLVERDAAEPVIAAWLAHLAGDPALPGLLLLPLVAENGPFAAALGAILRRAQMPCADFNRHCRAELAPDGDRSHYVEHALGPRRHRELRRIGRRLADLGAILFTAATEPPAVAAAIEDFFVLEASGWKGDAGTAAAFHDEVRRFITVALSALAAEGKVAINRIMLDGRVIAAAITLRSADEAWYWKTAYDETFARYAPGVFLTAVLTEELAEDAAIARTDSCAAPGNPMMDRIWCERLALCDRLIAVKPQAPFSLGCRLERARGAVIAAAKAIKGMRDRVRN
jgi:CelD/BcsL family acetyltransferase involved in cellulose biosynthesis